MHCLSGKHSFHRFWLKLRHVWQLYSSSHLPKRPFVISASFLFRITSGRRVLSESTWEGLGNGFDTKLDLGLHFTADLKGLLLCVIKEVWTWFILNTEPKQITSYNEKRNETLYFLQSYRWFQGQCFTVFKFLQNNNHFLPTFFQKLEGKGNTIQPCMNVA